MSQEKWLLAVGEIDDGFIEEFIERDTALRGRRAPVLRRRRRLWWTSASAVAAVLALAIGSHQLMPLLLRTPVLDPVFPPDTEVLQPWSPEINEDVPVVEVTAEVTDVPYYVTFYSSLAVQSGIYPEGSVRKDSWYSSVSEDSLRTDTVLPVDDYLPVYERKNVFHTDMLDAFIQKWLPTAGALTGITDTEYDFQWAGTSGVPCPVRYSATVGSRDTGRYIRFVGTERTSLDFTCPAEAITERELFPTLRKGQSDGEILSLLEGGIDYLRKALGQELWYGNIERTELESGSLSVMTAIHEFSVILNGPPPAGSEAFPHEIASVPAYTVSLHYAYVDYENSDELVLERITYSERLDSSANTVMVGKAETLPLAEAENLLNTGYVYGPSRCLRCRNAYCDVDFSDYDAVGLVYLQGYAGKYDWVVPFYAFYKEIPADGKDKTYAVVYVPAVKVTGLEAYFAACTEKHDHSAQTSNP